MPATRAIRTILLLLTTAGAACPATLYVSPAGSDRWSGRLKVPNPARTDGPLASLAGARDAVRRLKADGGPREPVRIAIQRGTYRLTEPFVLGPEDSGTVECPITYVGEPGARPIISGGRPITGWRRQGRLWVADGPEVRAGRWVFESLWINGQRRTRARTPNTGYFHTTGKAGPGKDPVTGKDVARDNLAFRFREGDIQPWPNLSDVVVVAVHSWENSRHRIAAVEPETRTVVFTGPACWPFQYWGPRQRYYVENAPDALDAPGEWYLDRQAGRLSYLPRKGEDPRKASVVAPVATQLILLEGKPAEGRFVEHVRLKNLRLMHTDMPLGPKGHSDGQAAVTVPGAVQCVGARDCAIERCEIARVGTYGVWLRAGCRGNRVFHNEIHDMGGGGVRLGEAADAKTPGETAERNVVENNFIHDGGKWDSGAVGVWIGRTSYNTVSHNEICDLYYTGVSVGWSWGYSPSSAHHNVVEQNHIHHIGQGVQGDMGGIYCLGDSPGTVLRGNLIHDVIDYGTWGLGIYTDEGSTGILIEGNVVYHASSANFHQHYGRENVVRNNIFAFGHRHQLSRARQEEHLSFTFERNLVVADNGQLLIGTWATGLQRMDRNLYWDYKHPVKFAGLSLSEWQAKGHDRNSVIADPLFVDPARFDFRLKRGSPAERIGFRPIDTSRVGLTGEPAWVAAPRKIRRPPDRWVPPPPPPPEPIDDGFEETPVGLGPDGPMVIGETEAARIRVTDGKAASGKHSLQFVDAAGLDYSFNPHLIYGPNFTEGVMAESFDVFLEPGAYFCHEWRDVENPYRIGPSLWMQPDGRLMSHSKEIGRWETGKWLRVEITCGLGKAANGAFDLTITPAGGEPQRFVKLPCNPEFRELRWLGFIANASEPAIFYVDNLKLPPRR